MRGGPRVAGLRVGGRLKRIEKKLPAHLIGDVNKRNNLAERSTTPPGKE